MKVTHPQTGELYRFKDVDLDHIYTKTQHLPHQRWTADDELRHTLNGPSS